MAIYWLPQAPTPASDAFPGASGITERGGVISHFSHCIAEWGKLIVGVSGVKR